MNNKHSNSVYYSIIVIGALILFISAIFTLSVVALIGLGLLFLGLIISFIHTDEYVKKTILDDAISSEVIGINELLKDLNYSGKVVYLPSQYFKNLSTAKIWISKEKNSKIPTLKQIQQANSASFLKEPEGILITAPGASMMKRFENLLNMNFINTDISNLINNLPKIIIDDLEFTNSFKINCKDKLVTMEFESSIFQFDVNIKLVTMDFESSIFQLDVNTLQAENYFAPGIPLCSAIACSLSKAAGKPISINDQQFNVDSKLVTVVYAILDEL